MLALGVHSLRLERETSTGVQANASREFANLKREFAEFKPIFAGFDQLCPGNRRNRFTILRLTTEHISYGHPHAWVDVRALIFVFFQGFEGPLEVLDPVRPPE